MSRKSASGADIGLPGQILAGPGLLPGKHRDRPSDPPKAGRRAEVDVFPVAVRPKFQPGRPIYGPEALLRNIEYIYPGIRPQTGQQPPISEGGWPPGRSPGPFQHKDENASSETRTHTKQRSNSYPMLCQSASGLEIGLPGRMSAGF